MSMVSHLHHLFNPETCQAYIHRLRWKDRPLQCPRCQSHHVGPWGAYHYQPGLQRYRCKEQACKRTFNDLTGTLLDGSKRSLMYWILATFLLCLSFSSRRMARELGGMTVRAIVGAGGCAIQPSPTKPIARWRARWKRMHSITPPAARGKPNTEGQSPWGAARVGAVRSASPGGGIMTKCGDRGP